MPLPNLLFAFLFGCADSFRSLVSFLEFSQKTLNLERLSFEDTELLGTALEVTEFHFIFLLRQAPHEIRPGAK